MSEGEQPACPSRSCFERNLPLGFWLVVSSCSENAGCLQRTPRQAFLHDDMDLRREIPCDQPSHLPLSPHRPRVATTLADGRCAGKSRRLPTVSRCPHLEWGTRRVVTS